MSKIVAQAHGSAQFPLSGATSSILDVRNAAGVFRERDEVKTFAN